jgi:hypothetical protein
MDFRQILTPLLSTRPHDMAPKLVSHKLQLLSDTASRQLFRQCAGRQDATDAGPAGLEDSIVRACGGMPLALRLAGGALRQEGDADLWQVRNLSPCMRCVHAGLA